MNETIAKLKTIRQRTNALMELHNTPPMDMFDNLRDQFLKEADKLKEEYQTLSDFKPENYAKWVVHGNAYYKWATRALINDIDYFLNFLNNIQTVQLTNLKITNEGLFFSGQYFEALSKLVDIIKTAKTEIIFIDGYVDEKILNIFSVTEGKVKIKILTKTKSASAAFTILVGEYNKQYGNTLEVKASEAFHDRFLILDQYEFYHIGASMKDAGNRGFMFSRIEEPFLQKNLISEFTKEWK
jgi:sugar-specific transcriptional regulator TrmB